MPLYASAFFIPTSAGVPYILEDIYIRGSYRSVATIAERDAIRPAARKQGMICFVREDLTFYWLPDTVTAGAAAWKPWDVTRYVNFDWQSPLSQSTTEDGKIQVKIDETRIVPVAVAEQEGMVLIAAKDGEAFIPRWVRFQALPDASAATQGNALVLDAEKNPVWGPVSSLPSTEGAEPGASLVLDAEKKPVWGDAATSTERAEFTVNVGTVIESGTGEATLELPSGTVMLQRVAVSHPDLVLELHNSPDRDDVNPFVFESSVLQLEDNGTTMLEDGELVKHRRYGFYVAREKTMYIKVTNKAPESAEVVISFTLLPME